MRLATLRVNGTTRAAIRRAESYTLLDAADVAELLRDPNWRTAAVEADTGNRTIHLEDADFAPLVTSASKIICCGLNYADHILETGRETPAYPTLFGKYNDTLTGAYDAIDLPLVSDRVDWEAELAVVVGCHVEDASEDEAAEAIAGYTVANDISMRDWQQRTIQWMQGKVFTATTPLGPELVTVDECDPSKPLSITGRVGDAIVQQSTTNQLVFTSAHLVSYISRFTKLSPGDVILTGTPGGVGMASTPPRYLQDNDVLTTEIEGVGKLVNRLRSAVRA